MVVVMVSSGINSGNSGGGRIRQAAEAINSVLPARRAAERGRPK